MNRGRIQSERGMRQLNSLKEEFETDSNSSLRLFYVDD